MISLKGLTKTFTVTKNPYPALIARLTGKRRQITFANGAKFRLTWRQFTLLRDNYEVMQKYHLEQVDDESFKFSNGRFTFVGSPVLMCLVAEQDAGVYECDCRGKVVLDIGGFQGESAVFFSGMGAKKVVIYEPVAANHRFIEENIRLNKVNAEIHEADIGAEDGEITVRYDEANNCFGLSQIGPREMKIKIRNITKVIEESGAEVTKIDAEGAEESLLNVPAETLKRVELYIIEVHTPEIKRKVIQKFMASGFNLIKDTRENEQISLIFLERT
jgi:FkbM family methyltransferase